jgi:hypothetical protein
MRDNENVQHPSRPLAPAWAVLKSGTQFSTLNSAGINDPERPEKYNNTEVKYGATFTAATQAELCLNQLKILINTFQFLFSVETTCAIFYFLKLRYRFATDIKPLNSISYSTCKIVIMLLEVDKRFIHSNLVS